MLISCPVSQEITVEFPKNANWHFEYYDVLGENLGFGKAVVEFDDDNRWFNMTLTENAFGDKALVRGKIMRRWSDEEGIPFRATGTWFAGEEFRFEGAFNLTLTGTLNCSIAYARSIRWDVRRLSFDLKECRVLFPEDDPDDDDKDEEAVEEDPAREYVDTLFTWKAQRILQ